ncbi:MULTISPECIES: V-type ATP synthase subunit E [Dethiosulfovibrio]|uniref:V-type ATP synthase subunit E n=2 Tax=Dethiosulfovibrio TaxID=47054 RepID=A0ABS9ELH1_9BACT|nr:MULTISPECIES: V-type ATP synthase subunit E [Dethiosulfovibrio]MCF4113587.1 V-type ATP synthase subunit E [Dethiosulfovibrio russensis]MCF4142057.1 V-type ATP synthase subunit E [Dethiosulfovibrio marinus]MCF4144212.1 V-type ATP synthase subunit E [Dethiosulfovibrio acidaminovorans]
MTVSDRSDLEDFLSSIRKEGEERLEKRRSEIEDRIADMIALRRQEVESLMKDMREEQRRKIDGMRRESRLKLRGEMQRAVEDIQRELAEKVRIALEKRLDSLTVSEGDYLASVEALTDEALSVLGEDASFSVSPSLVDCLSRDGRVPSPLDEDDWGGCVAVDTEGGAVVDNTFRSRLDKVFQRAIGELAVRFDEVMERHPDVRGRLRLS